MKIEPTMTDDAVAAELGERIRRTRLQRNLTQLALAAEAGVERKAIQRVEAGEPVRTTSFFRVLRALGLLEGLDRLVPAPGLSPIELLELRGRQRERASGGRRKRPPAAARAAGSWRWGDEAGGDR